MKKLAAVTCLLLLLPKDSRGFSNRGSIATLERTLCFPSISSPRTRFSSHDASASDVDVRPVQKVAIIGAGIAGLSLAHALLASENSHIQVDIFDSRPELDEKAGSGIQLTGGLVALNQVSPKLYRQVADAGLSLESVTSRCRPWFGSNIHDGIEQGWELLQLDIQKALKDDAASKKEKDIEDGTTSYKLVTEEGEVVAYTILRGTLQSILHEELIKEHGIQVQFDKKLSDLSYSDGIRCQFNNNNVSSGPYDLVVGADGVRSVVKQYIDSGTIEKRSKSVSSAIYSGIRITFAISDGDTSDAISSKPNAKFTQFFGNSAYCLTSTYGAGKEKPPAKGAFLIYADENYIGPFKRKRNHEAEAGAATAANKASENADWTQDKRIPREHINECLSILESASVPGNVVANIVESSDRFFDLGVYFHNPFSWNGWVREFVNDNKKTGKFAVLAGDAAHAMPPFLGQGANQALQDSYVLASKIHEYNKQLTQTTIDSDKQPDLKSSLKEYERRRWTPTASITAKAAFLGYLETGSGIVSNVRDAFFFVMGKIGVAKRVFLDSANPNI